MINYDTARRNMVDSQIRTNKVTDLHLIAAITDLPREKFVPAAWRALAYVDEDIPLGAAEGGVTRHLMEPMPFARLVQLAAIRKGDYVLDIGCGTGYSTAVIARLADQVVGLESDEALATSANETLTELDIDNAVVVTGPLQEGYAAEGPYDVIVFGGAVPEVAPGLFDQLKPGGRLVAVIMNGPMGRATLFTKTASEISDWVAFDATVHPLPGFEKVVEFTF